MEFVFIGLAAGCAAFLFKIISEYLHETPVWQTKVEQAEDERVQYESQVDALLAAKNDSASQAKKMDKEIKSLEQMRDELKVQIETTKKEMARQGKIIMKRQPSE
ncbi:MAG: hypothetical protein HOE48_22490 [Candidatus Latescibacteria bacterium]|jgi:peptidoglycan hydrolase CwlO-like protein|nr:hypothetical protein [Candidatus Latescibacterota bacterium]